MKKLFLLISLLTCALSHAGNVTTYPNVSSVTSADILWDWQSGAQQNATALQLKTYVLGGGSAVTGGGTASVGSGKTATFSNTFTATATDGSTITFGAGGTVLYASGIGSTIQPYNAGLANFAALSAPATSGYVLSSTSSGSLSWVPPSIWVSAVGTNSYTATPSPAITSYPTGLSVVVTFANANTAGASLNLNSLGAAAIMQNGFAVTAGQIPVGSTLHLIYDGSHFQIVGGAGGFTFSTGLTNASGTVTVNTAQNITQDTAFSTAGHVLSDASGNLSIDATAYAPATGSTAYAPITGSTAYAPLTGSTSYAPITGSTNYAPATTGTSLLYANGSGGFSNVTIGSGLTFSAGTLSASGGGGGLTVHTGTFTMVSGFKVVSDTNVTANSVILYTVKTVSGTVDMQCFTSATVVGTGFQANTDNTDNSTYNYVILN